MDRPLLLLAEDNEADAFLLERALRRANSPFRLARVHNGDELIAYLERTGRFSNEVEFPPPTVVLLDLRMPKKDGFSVLSWRRDTSRLRLPMIVFTSSELNADVDKAYELGANSYVVKPTATGKLEGLVDSLHRWWADFNFNPKSRVA